MLYLCEMLESRLQAECFQWAYNSFPIIRGFIFHVPNGGTRDVREAMTMRAMGLTKGIPDILLVYPVLTAFEFKSETGRLSDAQTVIHKKWTERGIPVHVVKSIEQFRAILTAILLPEPS